MSEMEYNKGKLIPTEMGYKDLFEEVCGDYDRVSKRYSVEEWCRDYACDYGYEVLKGKIYKVVFEVERGDMDKLCNVQKLPDGSLLFETYHYNASHWAELVEGRL